MMTIPFDVNDASERDHFFGTILPETTDKLGETAKPVWGEMSAQHMLEHLLWAFDISNGRIVAPCKTPPQLILRVKAFLHTNDPTPRGYRNPLLGETPPPLRFRSYADAQSSFRLGLEEFILGGGLLAGNERIHPLFGPLTDDEWHRSHYKHCVHHLLQFDLIRMQNTEELRQG